MKVLFFNPNYGMVTEINGTSNYSSMKDRVMPYSLLVGASLLRKNHIVVDVYDSSLSDDNEEKTISSIIRHSPDILVCTVNILSIFQMDHLFARIKRAIRPLIVVWFTENFEEDFVRKGTHADVFIKREWYSTTLDLCSTLISGEPVENVKGVHRLKNNQLFYTGARPHLPIENTPSPSLDLVDASRYHHQQIILTEGCNYRCLFCNFGNHLESGWNSKSIARCLEELSYLRHHGRRFIRIIDNELTQNTQDAKELMRGIIRERLDLVWETNVRVSNMDEELVRLMAEAGCVQCGFGVESGVQEILDLNNKQITLDQVLQVSEWIKKYKIVSRAFFLVGLRGDTRGSIYQTFDFIVNRVKADTSSFDVVIPYRGTAYHDYLQSKGCLNKIKIEHVHWIYKYLYGYDFLDLSHTEKPDWRYENLNFNDVMDIMGALYNQMPHSNQLSKLKRLLLRKNNLLFFILQQMLSNPRGMWYRLRKALQ